MTGCTAQQVYSNNVDLLHTCGAPLTVTVTKGSNYVETPRRFVSEPDARSSIANDRAFGEHVSTQISDDDRLTLEAPDARRTVDGATLRTASKNVARPKMRKPVRSWTIDDGSFCP